MGVLPLHATGKVRIICPSKAKEPYKQVIDELSLRSGVQVDFVKSVKASADQIFLDECGAPLTLDELKKLLLDNPVFVVGGPDGLSNPSDPKYSLGPYTLNHQIAIIVLLDLIFRVKFPNHPYNSH